jgi:pimeloyl-ACP methyl ester carboxylesterase
MNDSSSTEVTPKAFISYSWDDDEHRDWVQKVATRLRADGLTVPVLVMHGDDDQTVPHVASAPLSAKLLKNSTLKTYKGFPHGMPTTETDTINADLLAFLKA